MKPDTERKKYYEEKLHRRKKRMHVHLSKALRGKLKSKRRAIGLRSGDQVRIMRGPRKGKEGKVIRVSTVRRKVYLEGMTVRNARAKEVAIPMEPSNLLLIGLEPTPERKKIFTEDAFRKKEPPKKKEEKKPEAKKEEKVEKKPEAPAVKPPVPKPGAAVSAQPTKR
jgi:ribosomal protein uL24